MTALLFGSISTLADTSELQREAFNRAFADHGLDWSWDREEYAAMLDRSGGAARIAAYAGERGEQVDADAVHATKSERFRQSLAEGGVTPRAGVVDAVHDARRDGLKVGLVTTTSRANIDALLAALAPSLSADDFDVVVDRSEVGRPKPDPEAYSVALRRLGEDATHAVAVEDNVEGATAATAAGLTCVAFPNANTADHSFTTAEEKVDALDYDRLKALATR